MSDRIIFNEFKKLVIADIKRLNKRNDYAEIKDVSIAKKTNGFEVIIYMNKDTSVMNSAIANVIYKYKPVYALSYGTISVTVTNSLGKQAVVRFTRRRYVE